MMNKKCKWSSWNRFLVPNQIMRLTGSRAYTRPQPVPKMPTGLVELMEDLTRDVLKHNPTDVYEFCADHMRKLLEIRDGPSKRQPLTLEEKIARAQAIVKKRGEARWKKYVKQQRIDYNASKVQSGSENILYIDNTSTKPSVHRDLIKEKASEIEISHEPDSVNHSPIKLNNNLNNTVMEDHTHYHETETNLSDRPALTDPLSSNEKFNNNSVSEDNLTTEIKTDENLPYLMQAENVDEAAVNVNKEELSNASKILNLKDEEKTASEIIPIQESALPQKEMVKRTDSTTEILTKSNMEEVASTAIGMLHTINESSVTSSEKQCYVEDINSTQDKINVQTDFEDIKGKYDSKFLSTQRNGSNDIDIVNKSEQETNNQGNNSLSDMGNVVNTAISVLNIINQSPRSPIPQIEACEAVNDINNHVPLERQENNTLQTNVDEVKQNHELEPSLSQQIESSDQTVNTPNQGTELQAPTSLGEMGKVVNAAIGILNTINESPRSQNQHTQSLEGLNRDDCNSDLLQTQHISQRELSNEIGMPHVDNITNVDNKSNKLLKSVLSEDPVLESSLKVRNIPMNEDVDDSRKQDNIMTLLSNAVDVKDGALITINESDHMKIDDGTTITEESKVGEGFENVTIESMNVASGGGNDLELCNQPITNDNGSYKDVDSLSSKEPLVNAVIINDTGKVQEELTEGKIEIRITQVAEALNNEVPLEIEDLSMSDESNSPFNSSPNKTKNESDFQVEQNNTDTHTRDIDSESNVTSVTLDDVPNKNITSVIKSTSIDESTDGMENTSLIESGTSDATDDMFLNNANSNNMDLETAAVTIQKVFRSFMFKSRASTFDDNDENISLDEENDKKDESEFQIPNNKERRGISRMDTVLQTVNEEKSLSLSTDDSSTISSAATTIQAHVRGFLVRNKLHSNKTASSNSLVNSDGHDDGDIDYKNNKTILNIHIVPEGGNYLSRDESILTSMDLSLDGSPPSSLNLHPLGYDKNERRKLKREDAIQSISPPSNNSGKLSEESVKDVIITESESNQKDDKEDIYKNDNIDNQGSLDTSQTNTIDTVIESTELVDQDGSDAGTATPVKSANLETYLSNIPTIETVTEHHVVEDSPDAGTATLIKTAELNTSLTAETRKLVDKESFDAGTAALVKNGKGSLTKQSSDEMDVVTPFEDKISLANSTSTSKLMHSGEFHDIVLPTKVSRGNASVVSEFKNVLAYFLLWNNS